MECAISAGSQEVRFDLSYLCDPFRRGGLYTSILCAPRPEEGEAPSCSDFLDWLERIVETGDGRIEIDLEGTYAELRAEPLDGGARVRFTVSADTCGEDRDPGQADLSVTLPRRALVGDFYSQLVAWWEGPDLAAHWFEWLIDDTMERARGLCPPEEYHPWPIRSARVERYLADTRDAL
jgi:hypothetical protein